MEIKAVSLTGVKVNPMPSLLLPQVTIFLNNHPEIKDFSLAKRLEIIGDFMDDFKMPNFVEGLRSEPTEFIEKMSSNGFISNKLESVDLLTYIFNSGKNKNASYVTKLQKLGNHIVEKDEEAYSEKRTLDNILTQKDIRPSSDHRQSLKYKPSDDDVNKKKKKYESPKLKKTM